MCNSNRIKCYGMIHHQFSGRLQGSGCQILSQEILQDPATVAVVPHSNIYVQIEFKYAKLVICRKKSRYDVTWRWDKTYSVVWGAGPVLFLFMLPHRALIVLRHCPAMRRQWCWSRDTWHVTVVTIRIIPRVSQSIIGDWKLPAGTFWCLCT